MADNVSLNAMSGGAVVATDDIGGGVQVQRMKAGFGADGAYGDVTPANPLPVAQASSATSAVTSVTAAASTTSLLASKPTRLAAAVFNDSTATLYLKLGATASTTSFTCKIAAGGYYELPPGGVYTGAIDGIWSAANGAARITEVG